MEIDEESW
jgi:hypothetical protein